MFEEQQQMYDEQPIAPHRQRVTEKLVALEKRLAFSSSADQQLPSIIPKGWVIARKEGIPQDVVRILPTFDVSKLRPCPFFKGRRAEKFVNGEYMRMCARQFGGYWGFIHGLRILAEQDKLHPDFRGADIPLPGTVFLTSVSEIVIPEDPESDLRELVIPVLAYNDKTGGREMDFGYLNYDYDDKFRLAV